MKVTLLVVGKLKDRRLAALCRDFEKRLGRYARVRIVEVRDGRASDPERVCHDEGDALLAQLPSRTELVALDSAGEMLSSRDLAGWIEARAVAGRSKLAFAIGGPFGLSTELVGRAGFCLSLSRLTFTHETARFLLLEQLYRAITIWRGVPYHH